MEIFEVKDFKILNENFQGLTTFKIGKLNLLFPSLENFHFFEKSHQLENFYDSKNRLTLSWV